MISTWTILPRIVRFPFLLFLLLNLSSFFLSVAGSCQFLSCVFIRELGVVVLCVLVVVCLSHGPSPILDR
jgi:hypothetical protein